MSSFRILFLLLFPVSLLAQLPDLPQMNIVTESAQNTLSWNCQYDGVKSIAVQRSADSIRNFVTVGILNAPKKGAGYYTDDRPLAGKNYYRLSILFAGDVEWFSNLYKVILDSAVIARSMEEAIKSGVTKTNTNYTQNNGAKAGSVTTEPKPTDFYYTPSTQIYTNPYTGHINISLSDALSKKYSIRIFDPSKNEVLRIARVTKTTLIVDKANFNLPGTYSFQLFDGTTLVETGYVTIY